MTTITRVLIPICILFVGALLSAQTKEADSLKKVEIVSNAYKELEIKKLEDLKKDIEAEERNFLKAEIQVINRRLDEKKITAEEAERLKKEAAEKRAANIENRLAIIDNKIALINRNEYKSANLDESGEVTFSMGTDGLRVDLRTKEGKRKPPKYDIRTGNKLLFAIGFNNTLIDGQSLDDSPYKLAGSGFVELGWLWETRLLKNSNLLRVNYGFSFQWNKLNIKDNQYFVQNGDVTSLQQFPLNLDKAKFRTTNLVFPVHFEIGGWNKRDYGNRVRYFSHDRFKVGIGGYGGFRLGTQQKLKYDEDGDRVKQKDKRNFNTSNFVYGLSAYIGIGDISLYAKYDLNPLFRNQLVEQNNISVGVRFDID